MTLEHVSQGVCMFDAQQRLIFCNSKYAGLYQLSEQDTRPGTPLRAILEARLAKETGPRREDYVEQRIREVTTNKPYSVVNQLRDGRYISVVHRPMPQGGWVATHEDVTEARRREDSFRLLFENNPVPMWLIDKRTLAFVAVNEAVVLKYGYSRETFLGMQLTDILLPDQRRPVREALKTQPEEKLRTRTLQHKTAAGDIIDVVVYSRALAYDGKACRLAAIHDVTRLKSVEAELRGTKRFLDAVVEHVPLPIAVKSVGSQDLRFSFFNKAYEDLTGEDRNSLLGKTPGEVYPKERAELINSSDRSALHSAQVVVTAEHVIGTRNKGQRLVIAKKTAIKDDAGVPQHLLTVLDDITEQRESERRTAFLAHHDPLTGLPNRASFVDRLEAQMTAAQAQSSPFAILCLDLDRFKEANDSFGHLAGDDLLCEIAARLRSAVGEAFIARIGGDEFTIVMPRGSSTADAKKLAGAVISALEDEFVVGETRISIGVSIGIAVYPAHGDDALMLLANADAALYQAKAEARGSIRIFDSDVAKGVRERRSLRNEIELALAQDAFVLHYQPQVNAQSGQPGALEALLRWPHPERGLIPPSTFIPIAEESRLIGQLGLWVLRQACGEAASWKHPLRVAINVSPLQFQTGDLVETVHAALLETGLPGNRLEIEITESVLIGDFSRVSSILRRLKALGVQIALDDFGTGYSSLSYLHSFPFDKIKLDRSFVTDLATNRHSQTIARSIIALSHNLQVPVIAEGVESEEQRAILLGYGCDEFQGFLTGKPRPIEDYAHMVGGQPGRKISKSA